MVKLGNSETHMLHSWGEHEVLLRELSQNWMMGKYTGNPENLETLKHASKISWCPLDFPLSSMEIGCIFIYNIIYTILCICIYIIMYIYIHVYSIYYTHICIYIHTKHRTKRPSLTSVYLPSWRQGLGPADARGSLPTVRLRAVGSNPCPLRPRVRRWGFTLWWTNIAMENDHRNSGFSH